MEHRCLWDGLTSQVRGAARYDSVSQRLGWRLGAASRVSGKRVLLNINNINPQKTKIM